MKNKKQDKKSINELLNDALIPKEEQPYKIPDNWVFTKLLYICSKPQYGWTTKASNKGKVHLLRTTDITSGLINWATVPYCQNIPENLEKYLLKKGDIVISRAGSIGVSYLMENTPKAVFASYLIRFNPLINNKYLYLFLKSPFYWNEVYEKSSGIALQNINATKLSNINIPLPPLSEQKRIVKKLESMFGKIAEARKLIAEAKKTFDKRKSAILSKALSGELTKNWRQKNNNSETAEELLTKIIDEKKKESKQNPKIKIPKFEDMVIPEEEQPYKIPDTWQWVKIKYISEVITGTTPSKKNKKFYGDKYPFIKPGDLNCGYYVNKSTDNLSELGAKHTRLLPINSILVTCIGATIGKTGFLRKISASNQQINSIVPKQNIYPHFIYFAVLSSYFQQSILDNSSATTLPIINKGRFENLLIPLSPLSEQKEIVRVLEKIIEAETKAYNYIESLNDELNELEKSILTKAFQGKLGTNNSNDEDALDLLKNLLGKK
jgi:type I restriction enzyme, S subunit